MDISLRNNSPELSISVIVPAYNCEKYLHKCVISILKSIDSNSEVLIINDGSTDRTLSTAEEIAQQEQRVRIISQNNQGVSAARNTGIQYARGKYVAFVDSDDWIEPPFTIYKTLLEAITTTDADIAIAGYSTSRNECDLKLDNQLYKRDVNHDFERLILLRSIGKPYGKLIRREFLLSHAISFSVGMRHQEDAVFLYRMLTHASTVTTITDATYHYVLPEKGKVYSYELEDEMRGYEEMCIAIDSLINSLCAMTSIAKDRLEQRKINMALHVYSAIQREPVKKKRINAYKRVSWNAVLSQLDIHTAKKWLIRMKLFTLADLISIPKGQ